MNQRLSQFSEIISNSSALKLLLIFVIINVGIVIMGFKQRVTSLQLHLFEITLNQRRLFPVFPIDINSNDYLNMHALPLKESLKMYESRRLLNQPKISEDYFRIWTIQSVKTKQLLKKQKQNCAIINSYNLVQQTTLLTAFQLLDSSTITKVLLLTRDRDQYSENLIGRISKQQYRVDNQRVSLDSDYQFIKHHTNQCKKIVYLQGNFQVSSQMAKNLDKQIKDFKNHSLIYSALGNVNGELKKFHPIPQINLENLLLEQIHQYLFVFDANLLKYITPLNFAYYAKYSFEQMIIWPMLAILQQTKLVHASDQVLHGFNFTSVSLPEFAVKPPVKQDNSICFISYPSDPDQISYTQIQSYLYSLEKMNKQKMKISIVIYVPYAYGHSTEIIKILQKLQKLQKGGLFERIRLRIRVNKTVSTLAAYESVYQYCPNQSLIVTSRHNIKFHEDFAMEILRSVTQKYHYIHTGFTVENQGDVIFMELPKYDGKYTVRRADWFEKYFMHFQVYKSDFLKTNLFWVLKNQELDFYETESPLVNLMMEETRLEFEYINKTLVTVGRRIQTELEKMQISHVKSYAEYSKLINNQLMPYKYNCLENPAYRRYAPELIQRNIHQIWITDQPVPKLRMVLHDSIKDKNPNFNVTLWKASDIKKQSFPVTYQIVQRTFEHHKDSDRSFFTLAADLLRYQLIYKYGGIYIDFKMEGKKALDNFLKYEIFYLDCDIQHIRLGNPQAIGIGVMGSMKNSYHMKKLLFEIIYEENIKFSLQIPQQTGGWNGRKSFTDEEFFTLLGLGYQLLFPLPYDDIVNACGGESKVFDSDQTVYEVIDVKSKKRIKIGLPCKQYPQAYLISYSPLAKTWLSTQQSQLEANRIVANQLNSHNN